MVGRDGLEVPPNHFPNMTSPSINPSVLVLKEENERKSARTRIMFVHENDTAYKTGVHLHGGSVTTASVFITIGAKNKVNCEHLPMKRPRGEGRDVREEPSCFIH